MNIPQRAEVIGGVRLVFDPEGDVLYARQVGADVVDYAESGDVEIVLARGAGGAVVGVTIIGASMIQPEAWLGPEVRGLLPEGLRTVLDGKIGKLEAGQ